MAPERTSTVRLTFAASGALAAAVVPVFLTGALSRSMGADLGFGDAGTGVAVTTFFVAAGVAASPMARVGQRVGARTAMRMGVTFSAAGCLAIAALATTFWHLVAILAVVGTVVGLVDTAAAGAFAATIRRGRQGLAFGIKEASVPIASMVAGVSVPAAAAWFGWRAAFVVVAALLPAAWAAVPAPASATTGPSRVHGTTPPAPSTATVTDAEPPPSDAGGDRSAADASARDDRSGADASVGGDRPAAPTSIAAVRWLALGIGAGAGAANAAATLLVPAASATGVSASFAGLLLAAASIASVLVRVGAGWASDRTASAPVRWVAAALALGATGTLVLAVGTGPVALTAGAMLALGAGWGWTGLAFLAAIRLAPGAPARAAGVVLTGLAIGGATGPSAFAALSARAGTSAAWWLATAGFLLGAAMTGLASRRSTR